MLALKRTLHVGEQEEVEDSAVLPKGTAHGKKAKGNAGRALSAKQKVRSAPRLFEPEEHAFQEEAAEEQCDYRPVRKGFPAKAQHPESFWLGKPLRQE